MTLDKPEKQTYDSNKRMNEEPQKPDTKTRILDAAERLFAEHGLQSVSLRQITALAGVNLAAVNYHFQSKEVLMAEVIKRRIEPINQERLARFEQLQAEFGDEPIPLEPLVAALLDPMMLRPERVGPLARLLGRAFGDPNVTIKQLMEPAVREVLGKFRPALVRAVPGASVATIALGMHFAIGAAAHWLATGNLLSMICGEEHSPPDREESARGLVRFACAGLRALVEDEVNS